MTHRNHFFIRALLVSIMALVLTACPSPGVKDETLSPLQEAYKVKDSLIIAKTALADLREAELTRRLNVAQGKIKDGQPFISDKGFETALALAKQATEIVDQAIGLARAGIPSPNKLDEANRKIEELAKLNGGQK